MRKITNINKNWKFIKQNVEIKDLKNCEFETINIPHTWNDVDGLDGGNDYCKDGFWYVKEFKKQEFSNGRLYVEFEGVNSIADVYLNGEKLAHHEGGYSTFRVDLTDGLKEDNILCVKADNSPNETIYPQFADFTFYGGVYRNVNFIEVNESHFDLDYFGAAGVAVTPTFQGTVGTVRFDAYVTNRVDGQEIQVSITDKNNNVVATYKDCACNATFSVEVNDITLWNGTINPYLYKATVELLENGKVIDNLEVKFGFRSFEVDKNRGFILNGKEYPLHGVSRHQDRNLVGGAITREHHKEDMEIISDIGCNTIRLAHYQHDQYFYDLCDEFGMVVWAEIPFISRFMETGVENTLSQLKELILQNYNHTSIVCWGISNEITIGGESEKLRENHYLLNNMCHDLDKTRLSTMAQVSMLPVESTLNDVSDIMSYNHYFGWYGGDVEENAVWFDKFHADYPERRVGVSEYGCEGILSWHSSQPEMGDYSEEYQAYYHERMLDIFSTRPYLWSTHVWNMFDFGSDMRDEGGVKGMNNKGLVTFDRQTKKDSYFIYRAYWNAEKMLHLCAKRYIDRAEEVTKVKVYSNLDEISLYVNNELVSTQKGNKVFNFEVALKMGENKIEARGGNLTDNSIINRVAEPNTAYSLDTTQKIVNWFDADGVEKEFLYPEDAFSIKDKLNDIMASEQGMQLIAMVLGSMSNDMLGDNVSGVDMAGPMMKMMGGMSLERLAKLAGNKLPMEKLFELNCMLNKIKK